MKYLILFLFKCIVFVLFVLLIIFLLTVVSLLIWDMKYFNMADKLIEYYWGLE